MYFDANNKKQRKVIRVWIEKRIYISQIISPWFAHINHHVDSLIITLWITCKNYKVNLPPPPSSKKKGTTIITYQIPNLTFQFFSSFFSWIYILLLYVIDWWEGILWRSYITSCWFGLIKYRPHNMNIFITTCHDFTM